MNSQKNQVRLLSVTLIQFTCTNTTTAQEATHRRRLWNMSVCQSLSRVQLFATSWTVVCQAPLSMRFSRQEYWSGLPLPSPRDLPDPGIETGSPGLQAYSLPSEPPGNRRLPQIQQTKHIHQHTPQIKPWFFFCCAFFFWGFILWMFADHLPGAK